MGTSSRAVAPWSSAALLVAIAACGEPDVRKVTSGPPVKQTTAAATSTPGAPAHELYAARGIACVDCHPCGTRSPEGHAQPWMDGASPGFHAISANQGLASCQRCHGPNLDGVGGSTPVSCAQCHGVEWRTTCTMCHGGAETAGGAPPKATWGNGADPLRVGAHTAHVAASRGLSQPIGCEACHTVPADALSPGHADASTATVTFAGLAVVGVPAPGASWDRAGATCSNTYCHGATLRGGGANLSPLWTGGPAQAACGSCHLVPPPAPHPPTAVCDGCHPGYTATSVNPATHVNGRIEAENLTCSSCHGDNSRVLAMQADPLAIAAPPYGSRGETDPGSRSVGQHQAHVNRGDGLALPSKCRYCHSVPTTFDHANGVAEVAFDSLATMGDAAPSFDGNTCSNTYCHGSTLGRGGTDHSPTWTNPAAVTCGSCHGVPPPLPHPQDSDCIRCHPGYTSTTVRKTTHVNGVSDFPTGCNSCHDIPPASGEHFEHLHHRIACDRCHAGYTTTTANEALHRNARQDVTLAGWDATRRTCSNISCHGSEYWGRTGTAARESCNQCHGVPPDSGQHFRHSEYACSRCHGTGYSTTTTNPATHMSGVVDVPYAFYDRAALSCSSAAGACHGSEPWGTRRPVTPNCSNCHGFPPSLPHPQDTACQSCHPSMSSTGVLTADHNNGTLDVGGAGCAVCHGFPPASTRSGALHPADANCYGCHSTTVDAQNQIVSNGTHNDGAVQVGGGGVGTYGCQSCHGDQARQAPANADPQVKAAPPLGTRGETETTTRAVGAHQAHVNPAAGSLAAPARCDECHTVPTAMSHANGTTVLLFGGRATLGGASPAWSAANLTCASTYCHGATLSAGGTNHAPSWTGGAAQAACGTCHGVPPPAPHSQSANCGGCHPGYAAAAVNLATHVNGSVEVSAMACNSCHGNAQNAAPPFGTGGESATTSLAVGAHQSHLAGGAYSLPVACDACHLVPSAVDHSDGSAQVDFGALARTAGAAPAWDRASATCSATWCHGQFPGGNLLNAPSWTTVDGTQAACGTCHGAPPPPPHTTSTSCGGCHQGYTQTSVNLATHVNGAVEALASPHAAGWADPAQHGTQANLTGLAGCASCHALTGPGSSCTQCHTSAGFASWDTTCTFCHGSAATGRANPPVDIRGRTATTNVSVGVHESHATTAIATPLACTECHPARTASVAADAAHVDGNGVAEVQLGALARTGGAAATYTRTSATSASCSSTYCHGRFSGGTGATVSWTSTTQVGCSSCHGNPPSTGEHSKHRSAGLACANCHNEVVSSSGAITNRALHLNGAKNVRLGGTWSGRTISGTWNPSTRTCSSLSCHGSETW